MATGKKAAKKSPSTKQSPSSPPGWVNTLHLRFDRLERLIQPHNIQYEVRFTGGAGAIEFLGNNIDHESPKSETFSVSQASGYQVVQVGGAAPVGGKIEVQVTEIGNPVPLSPFSKNSFPSGAINSVITYTI